MSNLKFLLFKHESGRYFLHLSCQIQLTKIRRLSPGHDSMLFSRDFVFNDTRKALSYFFVTQNFAIFSDMKFGSRIHLVQLSYFYIC